MYTPNTYERPTYRSTPKKSTKSTEKHGKNAFSEWNLAFSGLIVSIAIIISKIIYANRETIHDFVYNKELITVTDMENGQVMFRNVWMESVRYSNIWLPILCGVLTTYLTGLMVFLDSNEPGVQPPSPFSPSKYRRRSGHTFHSNYAFAFLIGVMVTVYMFWKEISL